MTPPLLSTKFFVPPARAGLVMRPRLARALDAGLSAAVMVVTAPPGFGKTTLLAAWVRSLAERPPLEREGESGPACAWLALDGDDNSLARFWTYAAHALQQAAAAGPGEAAATAVNLAEIISLLEAAPPPYAVFLTLLINALAGARRSFVLVLDDYHLIQEPVVSESLAYLIDHLPANLHLVIASRTDPPLPLGRWRARGQLHSLRAQDLRFSTDEAAEFFNRSMGLRLSRENVAELDQKIEGWAAGLQMAGFALQGQDAAGVREALASFSGRHHFLLDYFTDEILQRQPDDVQRFLLHTAVLDRMCAGLAAETLAAGDAGQAEAAAAQAMLERLERANLFVTPLDVERRWYRYHHLFNDLLLVRLRQSAGHAEEARLRRRAAGWLFRQGHLAEAVHQAMQAQAYDLAAEILESPAQTIQIWETGEVSTILKWIQALPAEVIRGYPWLRLLQSRSVYYRGQADLAETTLEEIEQQVRANPGGIPKAELLLGMVLSHRARYASVRGQVRLARQVAQQALEALPLSEEVARSFMLPTLALSAALLGDVDEAARLYAETGQITRRVGSRFLAIGNLSNLAISRLTQGRLGEAMQVAQEAIRLGTIGTTPLPVTGWPRFPLAEALFEQNRLAEAEATLAEALALVSAGQLTDYFGQMPSLMARIQMALGRPAEALATAAAALDSAGRTTVTRYVSEAAAQQARLWLHSDEVEKALRWAETYAARPPGEHLSEVEELVLAQAWLAAGRPAEARRRLQPLAEDARQRGRFGREIGMRLTLARCAAALGERAAARAELERCLSLAEPEGCLAPFLEAGPPLARLLREARPELRSGYLETVLRAFPAAQTGLPAAGPPAAPAAPGLVEALTPRELEVLRLLAEGLSNREIAARLYLSPNTLRVYTTNIYGKLGVHNRTQAVKRGQEVGLL